MKRKSLEVVLSLFNKHHDARNPANPSKQPKNGERVRLYQTGTLFTSAGLIEREPAAELYINFFHMVDVAGQREMRERREGDKQRVSATKVRG